MLKVNICNVFKKDLGLEVEKAFDRLMEERKKNPQFGRIVVLIRGIISKDRTSSPEPFLDVYID